MLICTCSNRPDYRHLNRQRPIQCKRRLSSIKLFICSNSIWFSFPNYADVATACNKRHQMQPPASQSWKQWFFFFHLLVRLIYFSLFLFIFMLQRKWARRIVNCFYYLACFSRCDTLDWLFLLCLFFCCLAKFLVLLPGWFFFFIHGNFSDRGVDEKLKNKENIFYACSTCT